MALTRWILALCGYARLEVCGVHPERVLNACAAAGIACTASEPVDAYTLRITVRARCAETAAELARRCQCEVKTLYRRGLPELLRRAAALPACPPPRMTPVQQTCLAQTIVWRHGMDALDDRDVVFPVRYAAATLRLLDCLAAVSGCTDAQLVVLVTREVENDPEALSRLRAGLQIEPKMNAQEALDHEKM